MSAILRLRFTRKILQILLAFLMTFMAGVSPYVQMAHANPTVEEIQQMLEPLRTTFQDEVVARGAQCGIRIWPAALEAFGAAPSQESNDYVLDECEKCATESCLSMLPAEILNAVQTSQSQLLQEVLSNFLDVACIQDVQDQCEWEVFGILDAIFEPVPAPNPQGEVENGKQANQQVSIGELISATNTTLDPPPENALLLAVASTAHLWGPRLLMLLRPLAVPVIKYVALPVLIATILIVGGTAAASYFDGRLRDDGVSTWDKVAEANKGLGVVEGGKRLLTELFYDAKRDLWDSWTNSGSTTTTTQTKVPTPAPQPDYTPTPSSSGGAA